jgi:hypothetical protein
MSSADRENVEEFLRNVFRSRGSRQAPRIPILPVLAVVALVIALQTTFYTIDPE